MRGGDHRRKVGAQTTAGNRPRSFSSVDNSNNALPVTLKSRSTVDEKSAERSKNASGQRLLRNARTDERRAKTEVRTGLVRSSQDEGAKVILVLQDSSTRRATAQRPRVVRDGTNWRRAPAACDRSGGLRLRARRRAEPLTFSKSRAREEPASVCARQCSRSCFPLLHAAICSKN